MASILASREMQDHSRSSAGFSPSAGVPFSVSSSSFRRRWEMATRDREKRQGRRRSLHCRVMLTDEIPGGDGRQIEAECINIGDGGLFAILPGGMKVTTGQRFTFQLTIGERGPEPGCRQCVSQTGEIIRVELMLDEKGCGHRIGIGVRLFGPRSGMVPMPVSF